MALGPLDGAVLTLPDPDLFDGIYVRKEAVPSSQIERAQSSLQDLLAAEAQTLAADRPTDVGEIVNYVAAMHYGLSRLETLPVCCAKAVRSTSRSCTSRTIASSIVKPTTTTCRRCATRAIGRIG